MSAPYRSPDYCDDYPAPPPRDRHAHVRVGSGTRDCPKPGWWSRLWHGFAREDEWTCDCGKQWVWTYCGDVGGARWKAVVR